MITEYNIEDTPDCVDEINGPEGKRITEGMMLIHSCEEDPEDELAGGGE